MEIGGDTNSTDGSESSIEHASGSINCSAGYNWWLMEQAKALNPAIKLYGLAWGAPGWIGKLAGMLWRYYSDLPQRNKQIRTRRSKIATARKEEVA